MFAVIQTGGKQYRVKAGDCLKVETLPQEVGTEVKFGEVLSVGEGESIVFGTPFVKKATVTAKVVSHGRHKKVRIIKFRRRKHHMKQMGHRQNYTQVEILSISNS